MLFDAFLMFGLTNGELVTVLSIVFGLIGSVIAVIAKGRQTRLETTVATAEIETKAKIDEASVLLNAYKELNTSLLGRITALETAADAKEAAADAKFEAERTRHEQTQREKARLEGQLAALLRTSSDMHIESVQVDKLTLPEEKP